MFSKKNYLYYFQYSSVIKQKFSYIAFNLTMYEGILGSQDFTNFIFLTHLGRFDKRLRAIALAHHSSKNNTENVSLIEH